MFNSYPYTNFHELNLAYFLQQFEQIFQQWHELYSTLTTWKDATTEELETWKTAQETAMAEWETALLADLAAWKSETEDDISTWEAATLSALDDWKDAFQTLWDSTFSDLSEIKEDAEAAKNAAIAAEEAAEAAAASIASDSAQILQNSADIDALERALVREKFKSSIINDKFYDFDSSYSVVFPKTNIVYTIGPEGTNNRFYAYNQLSVIKGSSVTVAASGYQIVFTLGSGSVGSWSDNSATYNITSDISSLGFWVRKSDNTEITQADAEAIMNALQITYVPDNVYDNEVFSGINSAITEINEDIAQLNEVTIQRKYIDFSEADTINYYAAWRSSTSRYVWNNGGVNLTGRSYVIPVSENQFYVEVSAGSIQTELCFVTSIANISNLSNVALCTGTSLVTIQHGDYEKLPIPPDCNYIVITKYKSTTELDFTPASVVITNSKETDFKTVYVDSSGNDTNSGVTPDDAFATVNKALGAHPNIIIIAKGTYAEANFTEDSWYRGRSIEIYGNGSVITTGNGLAFQKCNVYISGLSIDVSNSDVSNTYGFLFTQCTGDVVDCEATGASGAGGFRIDSSNMTLTRCTAHGCSIDGFNGHKTVEGVETVLTLNNCKAYNNADDGASVHENGQMYINGGEYYGNTQAGLAPHNNTYFEAIGVHCHNNAKGIEALKDESGTGSGKVISCIMNNNSLYGLDVQYYSVSTLANGYSGNGAKTHAGTGGTITTYTAE